MARSHNARWSGSIAAEPLRIPIGVDVLEGDLVIPGGAAGLVVFAHGSGSSRHSTRNRHVAEELQGAGLATLLFDLLTMDEERIDLVTREYRFDIDLLAERLVAVVDWLRDREDTRTLDIGLFGASTGAAAALVAAGGRPDPIAAVVSRGGRPDLAGDWLERVRAPTLLIVGGLDAPVIEMNKDAFARLTGVQDKRIEIVPGATHLFEEPGKLEVVARLTVDWFRRHLGTDPSSRPSSS